MLEPTTREDDVEPQEPGRARGVTQPMATLPRPATRKEAVSGEAL